MSSAGSIDSALTNHGYHQAVRLGLHFKSLGLVFTHLFSSHLQRAAKTAGLIREAQLSSKTDASSSNAVPEVIQLRILVEQDFGYLEGQKWSERHVELRNKPGFVAVETKEAMGQRADAFLDKHLLLLLDDTLDGPDPVVAIVSHGIFLSTLWKRLLRRLPARSILLSPDLQSTAHSMLEHLGGWSNTGYLELHMTQNEVEKSPLVAYAVPSPALKPGVLQPVESRSNNTPDPVKVPQSATLDAAGEMEAFTSSVNNIVNVNDAVLFAPVSRTSRLRVARGWATTILTINNKDHLKGLKRTGGGVGSSRHDSSQKAIDSFFKRRKAA